MFECGHGNFGIIDHYDRGYGRTTGNDSRYTIFVLLYTMYSSAIDDVKSRLAT